MKRPPKEIWIVELLRRLSKAAKEMYYNLQLNAITGQILPQTSARASQWSGLVISLEQSNINCVLTY